MARAKRASAAQPPALRTALLAWYERCARDLPWRRSRDPYAIWISEIMLQQTRVDTVIPYYERFLARFPSVRSLADAALDDVLAHWSGLGYYRRARLMHAAAAQIARDHGGELPRAAEARRALPGIGRYTAGAIGSIAFDLPEPIVDGNVARVLARVHAIDTPLGSRETEQRLWSEAEALANGERPGALNQALMELGALICTPSSPRCDACPIRAHCRADAAGRTDELPIVPRKKAPKSVALVALRAYDPEQRVWLVRGEGALFGGLWGCPLREGSGPAVARALAKSHGLRGKLPSDAPGRVTHVLTHRALSVEVYTLAAARGDEQAGQKRVALSELDTLGIAKLTQKILAV